MGKQGMQGTRAKAHAQMLSFGVRASDEVLIECPGGPDARQAGAELLVGQPVRARVPVLSSVVFCAGASSQQVASTHPCHMQLVASSHRKPSSQAHAALDHAPFFKPCASEVLRTRRLSSCCVQGSAPRPLRSGFVVLRTPCRSRSKYQRRAVIKNKAWMCGTGPGVPIDHHKEAMSRRPRMRTRCCRRRTFLIDSHAPVSARR